MARILINDGMHPTGVKMLTEAGHEVITDKIAQEDLMNELPAFDGICVRSATKVRQPLIENCPNLKFIGRGGVGLDNIDVDFARSKGIAVLNTPAASSRSVAELVFGHFLSLTRFLHVSNRQMPNQGNTAFGELKKSYAKGVELENKTLGIIGLGRIGQETARIGLGMGMNVIGSDPFVNEAHITCKLGNQSVKVQVPSVSLDELLAKSDFISLHIPSLDKPVLDQEAFSKMKDGVVIVNAARGGTVDEEALLEAIENGKVAAAGLDVFIGEPTPKEQLLNHDRISVTPHIGAATGEAQEKIGIELAEKILEVLNNS